MKISQHNKILKNCKIQMIRYSYDLHMIILDLSIIKKEYRKFKVYNNC